MAFTEKPLEGEEFERARSLLAGFIGQGDTIYLVPQYDKPAGRYWFTVLIPGTKPDGTGTIHNITQLAGNLIGGWHKKRERLTHNSGYELVYAIADVMAPEGVSRYDYYLHQNL